MSDRKSTGITRRALLKAAGGSAIAASLLSPFRHLLVGRAAADDHGPRKRFVVAFSPNGTIFDQWLPTGTGTAFTLGSSDIALGSTW